MPIRCDMQHMDVFWQRILTHSKYYKLFIVCFYSLRIVTITKSPTMIGNMI